MPYWELTFTGFLVFWGTLTFLRIVGQEVHNQKQLLRIQKKRREDELHHAAMQVPIIKATPYEIEHEQH